MGDVSVTIARSVFPFSPNLSCATDAMYTAQFGALLKSWRSRSVYRLVVKLNWLVFCVSCAARGDGVARPPNRNLRLQRSEVFLDPRRRVPLGSPSCVLQVRVRAFAVFLRQIQREKMTRYTRSMKAGSKVVSAGNSGTVTSGIALRTSSRSAGLSSMKTKLSVPMSRSCATSAMFSGLLIQLILRLAKSLFFKIMSPLLLNNSSTSP